MSWETGGGRMWEVGELEGNSTYEGVSVHVASDDLSAFR